MGEEDYSRVDSYLDGLFGPADPALTAARERAAASGLPDIAVSPNLGRFLHVLALARGARSILEIGTLAAYSTIWLARALPDGGRLVSLELEDKHAEVARANVAEAGLAGRVDIRVGPGLDLLAGLEQEGATFDMVFIDADKPPYADYLRAALRLAPPGALIVADNVVRAGKVALGSSDDPAIVGVQRFNAALAAEPRVAAAIVQQVGLKGHDGMAFAVVREPGTAG